MESVGLILRNARLQLGLTPEDVCADTRISLRHVTAIEADQLDQLSSRFLYKSFARQMGRAVTLDAAALEPQLQAAAETMPEPLFPGQPGTPSPPKLASLRSRRLDLGRWASSLSMLVVALFACSAVYGVWQHARTADLQAWLHRAVGASQTARNTAPPFLPSVPAPPPPADSAAAMVASAPPEAAPLPATTDFHIQLSAIERTWLSVVADGHEVYNGILKAAESRTLEGHDTARIRTGNAGGIEVVFNGHNLGALGSRGQVRTVVFNRDGYEVLAPRSGANDDFALLLVNSRPHLVHIQPIERW